jgi:membrane-bound serine protease (ClpP class)
VLVLFAHLLILGVSGSPAAAQKPPEDPAPTPAGVVDVVEVNGLLDGVLVDFVTDRIDRAETEAVVALVLQLDSGGAVVGSEPLDRLAERIRSADVPIHVWVGPSGSSVTGAATRLLAAAAGRCADDPDAGPCVGVAAPGARVEVSREMLDVAAERDQAPDPGEVAVGDVVDGPRAVELGVADTDTSAVGDFVVDLPGVESRVVEVGDQQRREPVTRVRFAQLPLAGQLLHTVASPPVAYLLFVIGLALLIFELYTAGVGIAGMVGAGSLVLGAYGLAELPTRPLGVALLLFAGFGYAVDVQTGIPRVWTGIATAAFVVGSVTLYDGVSMSWVTLVVGIIGMTLAMIGGMPAMVRSRFSTPTIGREWMVGEGGTAVGRIAPDGVVTVRDAPWRARTNRATPVEAGDAVRVVSIDGLVLEVEPEEGAARDHRG